MTNSNFGRIWVKGYHKSFCILPGEGIVDVKNNADIDSFGIAGDNYRYPPKFESLFFKIPLPQVGCEYTCSYCCANVNKNFLTPASLEVTKEHIKNLPVYYTTFDGKAEYIKMVEAFKFVYLVERYGVTPVVTCNWYPKELDELFLTTKLAKASITVELPKSASAVEDRSYLFDKLLQEGPVLNNKYKNRVMFICLIPLDGDPNFLKLCIERLLNSGVSCSWSVILPVNGHRDSKNEVLKMVNMLASTFPYYDSRISNILTRSLLDVLLYGFTCATIQGPHSEDSLYACPVSKIEVKDLTIGSIKFAQSTAASMCFTKGNSNSCDFIKVSEDSCFGDFEWNFLAVAGEKLIKTFCSSDEDIESLFNSKDKVTTGTVQYGLQQSNSGRAVHCKYSLVTFMED